MLYAGILAGGRSSRMGEDKAGLEFHGVSLLERARELVLAAGAEIVLISGKPEEEDGVADLLPHCGPPGGVYSLLEYIRQHYGLDGSSLLLIPVDMPLLSLETVKALERFSHNASCCHYDGEVFPCLMKATQDLYCHVRDLFTEGLELGGRRSMHGIMNYEHAKILPKDGIPEREFLNANTPGEWNRILKLDSAA